MQPRFAKISRARGLRNISVFEIALGVYCRTAELTIPANGNQGCYTLGESGGEVVATVPVRSLDMVVDENVVQKVSCIKIDVEGSELSVLQGARKVLTRDRPTVLFEINPAALQTCKSTSIELLSFLRDNGYSVAQITRHGIADLPEEINDCVECLAY